jgi:hypothetical protein
VSSGYPNPDARLPEKRETHRSCSELSVQCRRLGVNNLEGARTRLARSE